MMRSVLGTIEGLSPLRMTTGTVKQVSPSKWNVEKKMEQVMTAEPARAQAEPQRIVDKANQMLGCDQ